MSMADSYQCMAKTTKYCKVISLQLIKINEKKKKKKKISHPEEGKKLLPITPTPNTWVSY